MSTDAEWELWGKNDPYFGVVSYDRYRSRHLTDEAKREFNELFFLMQSAGMHNIHVECTDHGGECGLFLYAQKR